MKGFAEQIRDRQMKSFSSCQDGVQTVIRQPCFQFFSSFDKHDNLFRLGAFQTRESDFIQIESKFRKYFAFRTLLKISFGDGNSNAFLQDRKAKINPIKRPSNKPLVILLLDN
jgi:hypothetical protein